MKHKGKNHKHWCYAAAFYVNSGGFATIIVHYLHSLRYTFFKFIMHVPPRFFLTMVANTSFLWSDRHVLMQL